MKIACERCKKAADMESCDTLNEWRFIRIQDLIGITIQRSYLCDECYDKLLDFMNAEEE